MSRVGTMPTRSNSLRAMIENSASPLPEAIAPTDAVEAEISPATGACTAICPPSGRVSRASTWPAVTVSPASTITSATFSPIRSGRTWFSSRGMMVPETSTILAKQDFAALSTVTAAPLAGGLVRRRRGRARKTGRTCPRRSGRPVSAKGRARGSVIGISFPVSVLTDTRRPAGAPSAKNVTPPRPADGLRRRRFERQRNAGEFVRAGDMPAIAGLTDDAWVSGSIWPASGRCRTSAPSMIAPSRCTMRWVR